MTGTDFEEWIGCANEAFGSNASEENLFYMCRSNERAFVEKKESIQLCSTTESHWE